MLLLGRILQLLFRDVCTKAAKGFIVSQNTPRNRVVAVSQTQEAAEAHNGVGDST